MKIAFHKIYIGFIVFLLYVQPTSAQQLQLTLSTGHLGKVEKMSISNDASLLATAGEDGAVKLWNINDKRLLKTFYPHKNGVEQLCFSEEHQFLATAGRDNSVIIWNIQTGEVEDKMTHLNDAVFQMKFIDNMLLFITKGGETYRWDWQHKGNTPDGKEIKTNLGNYSALNYSFKMNWLSVGLMNGELLLWRGYDRPIVEKKLHNDWISSIDFIPKDSLIVTASWDKKIKIWDANADQLIDEMDSPDDTPIIQIKYSSFFNFLIVKTQLEDIYFFRVENNKINRTPAVVRDDFEEMVFTEDTKHAAFTKKDGAITVWTLADGNSRTDTEWKPVNGHLVEGELNTTTGALAFVTTNGNFYSWEPKENIVSKTWKVHKGKAEALEYIRNGNRWITTGTDSLVKIWNDNGKLLDTLQLLHEGKTLENFDLIQAALIGTNGGDVIYWDYEDQTYKNLYQHNGAVSHVVVSKREDLVVSVGRDRKLKVYDITNQKIIYDELVPDIWLNDVRFSEDDSQLVVAGKTGVFVWNTASWTRRKLKGITTDYLKIDFIDKTDEWVFGDRYGNITLWNEELTEVVKEFHDSSMPLVDIISYKDQDFFFAVRTNMIFEVWNINKEKKVGKIVITEDGGWVIEHESGLFDVGALNMNNLYYTYGTETINFEQLREMYWEPGLAYELLSRKKLRKVPPLDQLKLFPQTNSFLENDTLFIEVVDRGGGVGKVSLYINNKEVISDLQAEATQVNKEGKDYYKVGLGDLKGVFIPNNENEISILTSNQAGTLNGRGLKMTYNYIDKDKSEPTTLYGVVVGVSDYRGRLMDLKYAAEDAKAMAESLDLASDKLFGTDNTAIQLITTDSEADSLQPTKENIQKAFQRIAKEANASDILFVFLAGHGTVAQNNKGVDDFHFLTKDMSNSDVDDINIKNNYTVNGTELLDWIKEIPISKQVFIVDACHAGSFSTELITARDYNEEGMKKRALERVRSRTGMFMLSGASSDKVSYESTFLEHGLLTYSLLDYLKRGELDQGKFVDVQDLFAHAVETVPELANSMHGEQQPEYRMPLGAGSFYIGSLSQDDRATIELSVQKNLISNIYLEDQKSWADHLKISQKVRNKIVLDGNELDLPFKYRKGAEGFNTFILRGKYQLHKSSIVLKLHLISNNQVVGKWTVKGKDVEECVDKSIELMVNHFN
ncbi:caspase family protein [Flammeovirga kamogawensis]|uniref:Caspase family protein n=1 Tax=Flammeovirga kamogawensis TaxID=373891 RepID=A0ABX8GU00_9BACT|nr:caspase family protein [Flammeovirga kamogawensis]MBB6460072.1 WD40 repeat protein [Flammeovirga kamogawensis]QWG06884.1 caspase family protein [Flammeovirga kamogawensis]TRX68706.1 hypothetical protein EO216_11470 [Flammeovirga kamogawensis]